MATKIEWCKNKDGSQGKTWNPVTGCTKISPGCQNCYAERVSKRLRGRCGYPADEPFRVTLHPDRLEEPLRWRKPSMVFVCSMGDLFHEDVPRWIRFEVMDIILQAKQHIFLILTKRPANMKDFFEWYYTKAGRTTETIKNLWLGITAENQEMADLRIPILLQIPAAVRFVSVEPMLGPIDLTKLIIPITGPGSSQPCAPETWRQINALTGDDYRYDWKCHGVGHQGPQLNWVICGGETGPGARPMHPEWVRSLKDQCQEAGVPFFFKQWGEWFPRDQWEWNPELILPDDEYVYRDGSGTHVFEDIDGLYPVHRVGKKAAGRLLDGRTWEEMPDFKLGVE